MDQVNIIVQEKPLVVKVETKEDGRHLPHGGFVGTAQDLYNMLNSNAPAKNEKFTITQEILDQKYITIAGIIIDNQSIRVFVESVGLKMKPGVDYSLSGNTIFWDSYELEEQLEVGEILHVFYY